MNNVALVEARVDALEMVRVGVRLSYVRATTGLPEKFLRDLWREIHGKSPSPGRTYCDPQSGLRTPRQRQDAAAFTNLYFVSEGEPIKSIEARRFIQAWKVFKEMMPDTDLNATLAWTIIRNVCARLTWREVCKNCGAGFIRNAEQYGVSTRCPFCAE